MSVGYALLAQELTINGSASIDSTWKVEITNITQKEINGGVTEKSKSYTATTANFDIGFTQSGDYVILMKETVLTNAELGDNYAMFNNKIPYYYSTTCRLPYNYPNMSGSFYDTSGCDGHTSYDESKIKEMLETRFLPAIDENNLKEIDGYKTRLIRIDELTSNLGWVNLRSTITTDQANANVPEWVYKNFGADNYWTMSLFVERSGEINIVADAGLVSTNDTCNVSGVRPVINLLKDNIS